MEGLQRSSETFRRSGSSGLVWEDRFLSSELNQGKKKTTTTEDEGDGGGEEGPEFRELRPSRSVGSVGLTMERSRSNGGRGYRTGRVSPALDPPSPKVSACGFCGMFGKARPASSSKSKPKPKTKSNPNPNSRR